eukprot:1394927-Prymnesium_polylepis.1
MVKTANPRHPREAGHDLSGSCVEVDNLFVAEAPELCLNLCFVPERCAHAMRMHRCCLVKQDVASCAAIQNTQHLVELCPIFCGGQVCGILARCVRRVVDHMPVPKVYVPNGGLRHKCCFIEDMAQRSTPRASLAGVRQCPHECELLVGHGTEDAQVEEWAMDDGKVVAIVLLIAGTHRCLKAIYMAKIAQGGEPEEVGDAAAKEDSVRHLASSEADGGIGQPQCWALGRVDPNGGTARPTWRHERD